VGGRESKRVEFPEALVFVERRKAKPSDQLFSVLICPIANLGGLTVTWSPSRTLFTLAGLFSSLPSIVSPLIEEMLTHIHSPCSPSLNSVFTANV
jgi:hypothetical protein